MISPERKDILYHELLNLVEESAGSDYDLYLTLTGGLGMTQEELHDSDITHLDEFFPERKASEKLQAKLDESYKKWVSAWLTWTPRELIDHCDEVEAITRMAKTAAPNLTEDDAAYLLRFADPLEVLADEWRRRFDMDALIIDDDISKIVGQIRDLGLDEDYETVEQDESGLKM